MKKIIELIPNTKVEINTDKNGKSVILYSDINENESKITGPFNFGSYVCFLKNNKFHNGIVRDIYYGDNICFVVFVPLEPDTFYNVSKDDCSLPSENVIKEIEFQMLKIGKKWDGENIVDIFWKPNNGEKYYCINGFGEISKEIYDSDYPDVYGKHLGWGNCFKTGEEAFLYRNKIKELLTNRNK
jgi:hypothetical protein